MVVAQSSRTCLIRIDLIPMHELGKQVFIDVQHPRVARQDPNGGQAGLRADHGPEVWAAVVLRPVRGVDATVDRLVDRHEGDLPCHAGSRDPSGLLLHCRLIPARLLPFVGAHVERALDHH